MGSPIRTVRIRLTLPAELLEAADSAVSEGAARSRNEFVALALRHELAAQKRARIDAAFTEMAQDHEYQKDTEQISNQFAATDWEAFKLAEITPSSL